MTTQINANEKTKYCFSYIRFSSKKQELGSSLERQEPIAQKVAKEKGWIYRPEWNAKNLGVSAYKGDNKKTLQAICEAAKQGKIPQGSVMILEALDRATRLPLDDAQDLIKQILRSGIEIFTDINKRHLTRESLNDVTSVIVTVVELDAAYRYSEKLSIRSKGGFNSLMAKASKGEKVYFGGMMPSFIEDVKNGQWILNQRRIDLVKRIFSEYIAGKSMNKIASDFNTDKEPVLSLATGKQWATATVQAILKNKAYTGDFSYGGKTFTGYIPQVITHDDFKKVQYLMGVNSSKRGGSPTGNVTSIFNGIAKCICGANMVAVTVTKKHWSYNYYVCSAGRLHNCHKHTQGHIIKVAELERNFILNFLNDSPQGLIAKNTPQAIDETITIQAKLDEVNKAIEQAAELIGSGLTVDAIKAKFNKLQTEKETLEKELQAKIIQTSNVNSYPAILKTVQSLLNGGFIKAESKPFHIKTPNYEYDSVKEALAKKETRQQLKSIMPMLVKEIRCNTATNEYSVVKLDNTESKLISLK